MCQPSSPAPLRRVCGFEVHEGTITEASPRQAQRLPSGLLAACLSSSQPEEEALLPASDGECDSELYSDDEDESASPNSIAIPLRDERAYKEMLRWRAAVNARLAVQQGGAQ